MSQHAADEQHLHRASDSATPVQCPGEPIPKPDEDVVRQPRAETFRRESITERRLGSGPHQQGKTDCLKSDSAKFAPVHGSWQESKTVFRRRGRAPDKRTTFRSLSRQCET